MLGTSAATTEAFLSGAGLGRSDGRAFELTDVGVTGEPPSGPILSSAEINYWTPADATALVHALVASFSVILVSELGDKTFIITAIMAMKNSRSLVFCSSALALLLMTVLSVGMGVAVTVIPRVYTHYASIVLFLLFGLRMLKEAYEMSTIDEPDKSEFEEVKRDIESKQKERSRVGVGAPRAEPEPEQGELKQAEQAEQPKHQEQEQQEPSKPEAVGLANRLAEHLAGWLVDAPLVINVFTMVFVAEWGDRSQISTVILAAREDSVGVFVGSFGGHVLCTGLAVVGGRFVAEMISVRTSK